MTDEMTFHNQPLTAETITEMRNVQLDLLMEVDAICKRNQLHYVLFAGTLLGAVRHQGFIPWDDDIDLAMPREHFERFLRVCQKELSSDYFLQTTETDPEYFNLFARLRKNRTLCVQNQYQHFKMHHGIFIDIFPLDNATRNSMIGSIHRLLTGSARTIYRALNYSSNKEYIAALPNSSKKIALASAHALRFYFTKNIAKSLYSKAVQLLSSSESGLYTHLTNDISKVRYYKYMISKEDLFDTTEIFFEKHKFRATRKPHGWLSSIYGDYQTLPPKNQRKPHHNIVRVSTKSNK